MNLRTLSDQELISLVTLNGEALMIELALRLERWYLKDKFLGAREGAARHTPHQIDAI